MPDRRIRQRSRLASLLAGGLDVWPVRLVMLVAVGVGRCPQDVVPGVVGGRSDRTQASLVGGVGALAGLGDYTVTVAVAASSALPSIASTDLFLISVTITHAANIDFTISAYRANY